MIAQTDFDHWGVKAAQKLSDNGGKDFYDTWLGNASEISINSDFNQSFLCMFALSEPHFREVLTDQQFEAIVSLIQQL